MFSIPLSPSSTKTGSSRLSKMVRYLSFSLARTRFLSWTSAIFSFSLNDTQSMLMASSMRSK